jgi:hypothetical protein
MSKNTLLFKRIDFWLQTVVILIWILLLLRFSKVLFFIPEKFNLSINNYFNLNPLALFYTFYNFVFAIQFLSITIHLFNFKKPQSTKRKYTNFFYIILMVLILSLFIPNSSQMSINGLIFIILYTFVFPFWAIFYLWITWTELQTLKESSKNFEEVVLK